MKNEVDGSVTGPGLGILRNFALVDEKEELVFLEINRSSIVGLGSRLVSLVNNRGFIELAIFYCTMIEFH